MRRKTLVEGIILLVIGLGSMTEGLRLILFKNPNTLYDKLGPGYYVLFLSIAMIATGIFHLIKTKHIDKEMDKRVVDKESKARMLYMMLILAIYGFVIAIIGYLVATVIFFLLEFRILGIKSWVTNTIITLVVTAVYYITFVQYCGIVFPRGILFR